DGEPAHSRVRVVVRQRVQERPHTVHEARMVPRQKLQREERRAAAGRARVLEPAAQELGLLVEAELSDRAVGDRALLIVLAPRGGFEVFVDRAAEIGERALVLGPPRPRDGLCERQLVAVIERGAGPTYLADGRMSRPVRICSRMCADQPATRAHAKSAGKSGGGMSAMSRTTADQNSTFVARTRSGWRAASSS